MFILKHSIICGFSLIYISVYLYLYEYIDIKGRRIQSLKSLGSYRHLLGVVLEVSHASDTAVNTTTGHARQPSTSATRNDGVTDKIGDLRYRVIVFDHFSDSDAPAESTRLCMRLREGAEYSILPLMALTTFTREWAALQCVRLQNLMLLTPYILKAAPVVSASRLEYVAFLCLY